VTSYWEPHITVLDEAFSQEETTASWYMDSYMSVKGEVLQEEIWHGVKASVLAR